MTNPAKIYLRRYRALVGRSNALKAAIDEAMERAFSTSVTLKEVQVKSSPKEHDPMARDICNAVDACEILREYKAETDKALKEILTAIDSLMDERYKELLTRRYVTGESFLQIANGMHYSEPSVYVIHGRALLEIARWLGETPMR